MTVGFDRPLYILAFDHRTAFRERLPAAGDRASIVDAKRVVFDGFLRAVANSVAREAAGIIVDEEYGADVAHDARESGFAFAMPVEASGRSEFDFAYGDGFEQHLDAFEPTFAKALVHYDADGDARVNGRQRERLARLTSSLGERTTKLMLEVIVPERESRVELMLRAIEELRNGEIEPDVWKVDALDDPRDCARIAALCRADGRAGVGVLVLGRGADEASVLHALRAAAVTEGYIGFAIGRTIWGEPLERYLSGLADRAAAEAEIAGAYTRLVRTYIEEKAPTNAEAR